jgi:hypothetical protein
VAGLGVSYVNLLVLLLEVSDKTIGFFLYFFFLSRFCTLLHLVSVFETQGIPSAG